MTERRWEAQQEGCCHKTYWIVIDGCSLVATDINLSEDAHLMAAAPELYRELKAAADQLEILLPKQLGYVSSIH